MEKEADFIFINGQVVQADREQSVAEAVAVKKNIILAVGTTQDILLLQGPDTHVFDLEGKSLLPGFIDAHAHIEISGTNKLGVNCKNVDSINDIQSAIASKKAHTDSGEWIRGWGYNHKSLKEKRHPTKWDLDKVSTTHPIIVTRTCSHISVVNSAALKLFGIDDSTPDPEGGKIGRSQGEVNGQLFESIHMEMYEFSQLPEKAIMQAMQLASKEYISYGITSVHEAGGYGNNHFIWLQKAAAKGFITPRLYIMIGSLSRSRTVLTKALEGGLMTGLGNDRVKIGPAKLFIDGSSSGPTAATREPYTSNPKDSGILYFSQEELDTTLIPAAENGNQITSHAMGDKGIDMLLKCIEKTQHAQRHRIEHCGIAPEDLRERIKSSGSIPILNPAFLYEFGDGYIEDYGDRVCDMFPSRDLLDLDIPAAIGSDNPITTVNPFIGLYASVTRKSKNGTTIGENQKVSLYEAIQQYTIHGAYASFEENWKGSIESGKAADLIVINKPILDVDPEDIKQLKVEATMINGKFVMNRLST